MLSVFDQGPPPPCPAPFNLAAYVLARGEAVPDRIALSILHGSRSEDWSFAMIRRAVLGTSSGLRRFGLTPGSRVLMRLGNAVEFPIAYLGCIAAGLIPVPTSTQLTETEVAAILSDLAPDAVLRDPAIACPWHPKTVMIDTLRSFFGSGGPDVDTGFELGDPDRAAYIIYTSGSSGIPRAVIHAHRAIWARRMMVQGWTGLTSADRVLHAGAFNWTYTLGTGLMDPWAMGATALIPGANMDLSEIPDLLARHEASIFAAAPGVYRKILDGGGKLDLPRLRHGLSAGEKLSGRLRQAWQSATGTSVYEAYGMSECSTFISSCPQNPARGAALGSPQPGRRVAIVDDTGPVPRGCEGTIAIHRDDPGLMLEYLNAPQETAARMQGEWFLTGDHGAMAVDGQITYMGRTDDMMNTGGYRVSPLEIEAALSDMPGIETIGVIDVAAKRDVRIIAAFYTGPKTLDGGALRRYAETKLARYKQPRAYVHLPSLPTGANGKLLRRALRAEFEALNDQT